MTETTTPAGDLRRHVLPATPPPGLCRLLLGAVPVGWVRPAVAGLLLEAGLARPAAPGSAGLPLPTGATPAAPGALRLPDGPALERAAALLAARGRFRPLGEPFAVRADGSGPDATGPDRPALPDPGPAASDPAAALVLPTVLAGGASPAAAVLDAIDRAALPVLGLWAHNAHLHGLVQRANGVHLWVATRAAHKVLGPGKLDQVVAGGVPLGLDARATLLKEAGEEAGLPASLVARAVPARSLAYALERPEGLRREAMHCFDLWLPPEVTPVPVDGEVAGFALWPLARVLACLRDTDDFLFDGAMAVLDLLLRLGAVS